MVKKIEFRKKPKIIKHKSFPFGLGQHSCSSIVADLLYIRWKGEYYNILAQCSSILDLRVTGLYFLDGSCGSNR